MNSTEQQGSTQTLTLATIRNCSHSSETSESEHSERKCITRNHWNATVHNTIQSGLHAAKDQPFYTSPISSRVCALILFLCLHALWRFRCLALHKWSGAGHMCRLQREDEWHVSGLVTDCHPREIHVKMVVPVPSLRSTTSFPG